MPRVVKEVCRVGFFYALCAISRISPYLRYSASLRAVGALLSALPTSLLCRLPRALRAYLPPAAVPLRQGLALVTRRLYRTGHKSMVSQKENIGAFLFSSGATKINSSTPGVRVRGVFLSHSGGRCEAFQKHVG